MKDNVTVSINGKDRGLESQEPESESLLYFIVFLILELVIFNFLESQFPHL